MNPEEQNQSKATLPLAPLSFSGVDEVLGDTANQTPFESAQSTIPQNQTPFAVDVPDAVPSTSLNQGVTREDVFQARDEMEVAEASPTIDPVTEIETNLEQEPSFGFNANDFVMNALFGESEPSEAELKQQEILDNYLQRTIDIQGDLNKTADQIRQETGLITREKELAETNLRIAQKTRSLRERLRNFDTSATERGRARNFVQGERRKIEADATAELADEYIIQAAQSGNLQEARGLIKEAVDGRIQSFEIQNQQDQARLNALLPTLEGEEKEKAQQLSFALQERAANIEKQRIEQEGIREMMITAAQNGASSATQQQILASGNVDDAMALAGPYIGRYDRMKVESTLATNALNRRAKLVELALSGDQNAIDQLGAFGESLQQQVQDAKTQEARDEIARKEGEYKTVNTKLALAERMQSNELGFNLSTGQFQNATIAGLVGGPLAGTQQGNAADLLGFTPVVGNIMNAVRARGAKEDFLADVQSLISKETLDELVRRKQDGATFGALSNEELRMLEASSQSLASRVRKDNGNVTGLVGTPQENKALIDEVVQLYVKAGDDLSRSSLTTNELSEIDQF